MIEVRRASDGELCGYVQDTGDAWRSLPMPGVAMVTVTANDLAQSVGLTRSVD